MINDAEIALARAHAADGEKLAPYETTLADLYLIKAREEQGHARYADARALAQDCIAEAGLAARKAAERRASPPQAPSGATERPVERAPATGAEPEPPLLVPPKPRRAPSDAPAAAPPPDASQPGPGASRPPGSAPPAPASAPQPEASPPERKPVLPGGGRE